MTLKKSSVNPTIFTFKEALKSSALAPTAALFAGLTFMIVVLGSASLFQTYTLDDGTIERNSVNFKYLFFEMPQIYSVALPILIAGAAGLTAITLFKFITSKKTVNVYYSLGVKRENLFMGRYLAGVLLIALAIILPFTIMCFINVGACGYSKELLQAYLYITVSMLSIAFTAFSIASAVFGAVGTAFETTLFTCILLFAPTILFYALQTLMDSFLYGNPYGEYFIYSNSESNTVTANALTDTFNFVNPLLFNSGDLALYSVMDKTGKMNIRMENAVIEGAPNFLVPLLWLVFAVVITVFAVMAFKRRKAEICGFIGMNKYLNTVTVFIAAFFVFCFSINVLPLDVYVNTMIAVLIFCVVYVGLELLILRDSKKFKKGLLKLPAELVLCGVAVGIFATGLFGFTQKIPEPDTVEKAAITFGGVNDEFAYGAQETWYTMDGVNFSPMGLIVDGFESDKDIESVIGIHNAIINDDGSEKTEATVKIVYTLKDGSTMSRSFSAVSEKVITKLLQLEKSDKYKERLYEVFKGDIRESTQNITFDEFKVFVMQKAIRSNEGNVYALSKHLNTGADLNLTDANRQKLADALYNDLSKRSIEEKYNPQETPITYLTFDCYGYDYINGQVHNFTYYDSEEGEEELEPGELFYWESTDTRLFLLSEWNNEATIAVTADMKETINILKDIGVYEELVKVPVYESAEIIPASEWSSPYTYYGESDKGIFFKGQLRSKEYHESISSDGRSFENGKIVSDKEDIKLLSDNAVTSYHVEEDGGYYVAFYTEESKTVITMYIPESKAKYIESVIK